MLLGFSKGKPRMRCWVEKEEGIKEFFNYVSVVFEEARTVNMDYHQEGLSTWTLLVGYGMDTLEKDGGKEL